MSLKPVLDFVNDPANLPVLGATALSLLLATAGLLYAVAARSPTTKAGGANGSGGSGSGGVGGRGKGKAFLTKEDRQEVRLVERIALSHDTALFRFGLPGKADWLGLPTGKHIKVWCPNPTAGGTAGTATWNGQPDPEAGKEEIERKYTPTSSDHDRGHFDLVIKVYRAQTGSSGAKFVNGGKMSQHFDSLRVGDPITIQGPWGLIEYVGHGLFKKSKKDIMCRDVGMMAGGTGITPMLQIIEAILRDGNDPTRISLLYANQTEEDILVRDRLEELQQSHPTRLFIWYTLDRPGPSWKYSKGFITQDMIKAHLPPPKPDTVILMCGPPPMIKFACRQNLEALGYDKDCMLEF